MVGRTVPPVWYRLAHYDEVHAITFDYGQRHREEIETARRLATQFGIAAHKVMDVTLLNELAVSALTRTRSRSVGNCRITACPTPSYRAATYCF